jgi:hypothetical protein
MSEIWKDVPGFEGLYQVSNKGNIRSLDRIIEKGGRLHRIKGIPLRQNKTRAGYFIIGFSKEDKRTYHLVHRLVADLYIPNPNNYPCVNHKDENKANNEVENLEWCTHLYNNTYSSRIERVMSKRRRPVVQLSLDGRIVNRFSSAKQASIETGINNSVIAEVCKNNYGRKTAGGFKWKYDTVE